MTSLDLVLSVALLGAGLVAKREALARPPAELIDNLDLLDDLPLIESEEAP